MSPPSDQGRSNRRGCFLIGLIALVAVLLFLAIGLGWLGGVDTSKNTGLPIAENQM